MRLTLKQHLLVVISCILLSLIVIGIFIVWPAARKILTLRDDIIQIESDLEIRYLNAQKIKRTERELEQITDQLKNYEQAAINKGDELRMITDLESMATKFNVEQVLNVALISSTNTAGNSGLLTKPALPEYYQFSFLINGTFANEIKYLQAIESLPTYIIIKNAQFEKRQNNNNSSEPPITLTFNGFVYVRPQ